MLRVKVESSVDIFRAFLRRLFLSFCVLLLIQTERTIHYKSLFYNERHSFRGSRVKAHTEEKVYFPFFFCYSFVSRSGVEDEENLNGVENYTEKALTANHHHRRTREREEKLHRLEIIMKISL